MNNEYVIVYADVDYGPRQSWQNSIIAKKSEIEKAKQYLLNNIIYEDSDIEECEVEYEIVPAEFL